jgi:DNA invertase Pin-like site-specific DNA recombinase
MIDYMDVFSPPGVPDVPLSNVAYSYTRFSSAGQEGGDSIRRQTALRDAWLARNPGVILDQSLSLIDRGRSAFTGSNRTDKRNALAQFLDLVERDRVPRGAWLIVESVDRLSREDPAEAIPFVLSLVKAGIRIVCLSPVETVYEQGMDMGRMVLLMVETFRGHGESKVKAERCGEAWQEKKNQARAAGLPIGASCPAWLALDGVKTVTIGGKSRKDYTDARYRLKPGAAAAVREIFRLAARGLGTAQITRDLNGRRVPAIGKGTQWVRSYVQKILTDRSVLGEYQPAFGRRRKVLDGEVIERYYPPAVTLAEFAAARSAAAGKATRLPKRRSPRVSHPLQGLLVDALDNCPMYTLTLKGRRYVISQRAYDSPNGDAAGTTHRRQFPLDVLQAELLGRMKELTATELFDDPGGRAVADLEAKLGGVERKLAIAAERFDADPENATWAAKVDEYDREKRLIAKELAETRAAAANPLPAAWSEAVGLMARNDPARLQAVLRRTINEIRVLTIKRVQTRLAAVQVFFAGGGTRAYVIRWTRAVALPHCQRAEVIGCRSLTLGELTGDEREVDLRNAEYVAALTRDLEGVELDELIG